MRQLEKEHNLTLPKSPTRKKVASPRKTPEKTRDRIQSEKVLRSRKTPDIITKI